MLEVESSSLDFGFTRLFVWHSMPTLTFPFSARYCRNSRRVARSSVVLNSFFNSGSQRKGTPTLSSAPPESEKDNYRNIFSICTYIPLYYIN